MQSTHNCWSDSLYLLLCRHVSSINSKDTTKWFHILYHRTLTKQQPYLVNHPWLQTNQRIWIQSLHYLFLREILGVPLVPHLKLVKILRDAKTHSGEHQEGSSKCFNFQKKYAHLHTSHSCKDHSVACRKCGQTCSLLLQPLLKLPAQHHKPMLAAPSTPTTTGSFLAWENSS